MSRRAALAAGALAALTAAGCAGPRWGAGRDDSGYRVRARAATADEARRDAVSELFELFMTTTTQAQAQAQLDREVLSKAGSFILHERSRAGRDGVSLSADVAWARLGRTLDAMGLVRGAAFAGRPSVTLRLDGDGEAPARAALSERLAALGYRLVDSGADVVVTGAAATAAPRGKLAGFSGAKVTLSLTARGADGGKLADVEQPAAAVDARAEDATAKAMRSAGRLAADALHAALSARFRETIPYTVTVLELGDLARARQWLETLRSMPGVAAAALDAVSDKDFRVRLYVRELGIDELTGRLLRLRGFTLRVRGVEPDFSEIELASGDAY